jgi:hypothetical protein
LAEEVLKRPTAVIVLALIGTIVAGVVTVQSWSVKNQISEILSEHSEINRRYKAYKQEFNVDEEYVLVIRGEDPQVNREVARHLGQGLEQIGPGIRKVFYRRDLSKFRSRALMFESEEELKKIRDEIAGAASMLGKVESGLGLNAAARAAVEGFAGAGADPMDVEDDEWTKLKSEMTELTHLLENAARSAKGEALDLGHQVVMPDAERLLTENEYQSFDAGKVILVLAVPGEREAQSDSPYSRTVAKIREVVREVGNDYPEARIDLTGEPVLNDDEIQTAKWDSIYAAIITLALIVILFLVGYREWMRPFLAVGVLLLAVVWALAYTMIGVGHLNVITQAFVPMMLGLGIDFGIQILGRYEEELAKGSTVHDALADTLQHTGTAIVTGGGITAVAFYSMCFNEFPGLVELGYICGSAMILALLANLVVLPAVFVFRDRSRDIGFLQKQAATSAYALPDFLDRWLTKAPRFVIALGLVATLAAIVGMQKVRFDYNLLNLQNPRLESVQAEHELFKTLGSASIYASVGADSLGEIRDLKKRFEALPSVKEVQSILSVLPENQDAKALIVQEIVNALVPVRAAKLGDALPPVDVPALLSDLGKLNSHIAAGREEAASFADLTAPAYQKMALMAREALALFDRMTKAIESLETSAAAIGNDAAAARLATLQDQLFAPLQKNLRFLMDQQAAPLTLEDVPQDLRDRFVGKTGRFLLQISSRDNIWERDPLDQFVRELRTVSPDVTGTPVQNHAYIELLRSSFVNAAVAAFGVIVVMILLHFRNILNAFLAIMPLALGVLWTVGLMGWADIAFNPANIMTLPMVIGIGVAYGVYTVDRFREDAKMDIFSTSTGKAILFSALTTIFAFAAMLVSEYRGLFSMGLVMTLGVSMCLVTSLVLLPQLLKLLSNGAGLPDPPAPDKTVTN